MRGLFIFVAQVCGANFVHHLHCTSNLVVLCDVRKDTE
jgi:hypothetical protein